MGGVHLGYNLQVSPSWVVGIEADYSWTRLDLQANLNPITRNNGAQIPNSNIFGEADIKSIGSVRGRIGYAMQSWLLYATGGWAFTNPDHSGGWNCNVPGCVSGFYLSQANFSSHVSGFVVGGGAEWRWPGSGWILGAEYLFFGLNAANGNAILLQSAVPGSTGGCTVGAACNPVTFGNFNVQVVRARLSYKF
jgi:outer membrane immunogenic protein